MYRYEKKLTQPIYTAAAYRLYTEELRVGFLDLETTGLSRRNDRIILGGLLCVEDDQTVSVTQLLCDHSEEEPAMLKEFWQLVRDCHVLVTYNGDSFDLPFLRERLRRLGVPAEGDFPPVLSFDLYRIFHDGCPMAALLPDLRQKTVEEALGLSQYRTDQIDGAESIRLFRQYESLPDGLRKRQLRDTIALHNRDDLLQLTRLMKILDKVDLHRTMSRRGFLVTSGGGRILTEHINLNRKEWRIEALTFGLSRDMDVFTPALRLIHDAASHRLTLQISVMYLQGCIIADLEALPGEYAPLERYPAYESGYLILHDGREPACAAMNHCIRILLRSLKLS